MNRKDFLSLTGLGLAAAALPSALRAAEPEKTEAAPAPAPARTGNGSWIYETVPGWGALPEGEKLAPTHGGFAWDKAGNLYANTDGPSGTLVYGPDGKFLRSIAHDHTAIHAMTIVSEGGEEFIYAAWLGGKKLLKLKLDGTVVASVVPPAEAKVKGKWNPTAVVVGPDGRVYVCDGYGDSRIHIFNSSLEWKGAFGGHGTADGLFKTSHGLMLDTRGKNPRLMVVDRENLRLSHFDLDGKFVEHRAKRLRRPCQISFHGKFCAVSELNGRVTILDGDDTPVAFLGDNPDHSAWANFKYPLAKRREALFNAAHGLIYGPAGELYVSEWSIHGRICKLVPVKA